MTILPFPVPAEASAFEPASLGVLGDALEEALQSLRTAGAFQTDGQEQKTREILARCIIELAKLGERDRCSLRDAALAHFAEENIRNGRDYPSYGTVERKPSKSTAKGSGY